MPSSKPFVLAIITIIAVALLFGCDGRTAAATHRVTMVEVPRVICECGYDTSGSPDNEQFTATKEQSKGGLEDFLQAFSCTAVRAYTFSDGFVPSEEWAVTQLPASPNAVTAFDPSIDHLKAADQLKRERRHDTDELIGHELALARRSIVDSARGWIGANAIPRSSPCTAIRPFVQMTQERRINPAAVTVVYTDGDDTGDGCSPATSPMPPHHPLIFIVIPQKVQPAAMAPSAEATAARLEKLYPGAIAIPYFELADPRLWSTLHGHFSGGRS